MVKKTILHQNTDTCVKKCQKCGKTIWKNSRYCSIACLEQDIKSKKAELTQRLSAEKKYQKCRK